MLNLIKMILLGFSLRPKICCIIALFFKLTFYLDKQENNFKFHLTYETYETLT